MSNGVVMGPHTRPPEPNRRHGARSRDPRPYDDRAAEIERELLGLPHIGVIDAPACREIAELMSLIERVDLALRDGVMERYGHARRLLDTRRRLSPELREWLKEIGGTPLARATWTRTLAEGSIGERIQARLAELNGGGS